MVLWIRVTDLQRGDKRNVNHCRGTTAQVLSHLWALASPARASVIAPQIAVPNVGPTAQSWCTVTQFLLQPFIGLL